MTVGPLVPGVPGEAQSAGDAADGLLDRFRSHGDPASAATGATHQAQHAPDALPGAADPLVGAAGTAAGARGALPGAQSALPGGQGAPGALSGAQSAAQGALPGAQSALPGAQSAVPGALDPLRSTTDALANRGNPLAGQPGADALRGAAERARPGIPGGHGVPTSLDGLQHTTGRSAPGMPGGASDAAGAVDGLFGRTEERAEHAIEGAESRAEHAIEGAESRAEHAVEGAEQRAEAAAQRVEQRAEAAAQRAEAAAQRAADRVEAVAESMTTAAAQMGNQVEQTADRIAQRAEAIADQVRQTADRLEQTIQGLQTRLEDSANRIIGQAEGAVERVVGTVTDVAGRLQGAADRVMGQVNGMVERLRNTADSIVARVQSFADNIEGAADRMTDRLGALINSLDEQAQGLVRRASTMATQLEEYVSALGDEVHGVINQVTGAVDRVMDRGRALITQAEGAVTNVIARGRELVAQVEGAVGRVVGQAQGLIQSASDAVDHAAQQARDLVGRAEAAVDHAVAQVRGVVDTISQTANRIVGEIGGLAGRCQSAIDQIMARVDETVDQVTGAVNGIVGRVGDTIHHTQEAIQNMLQEARRRGEEVLREVHQIARSGKDLLRRAHLPSLEGVTLREADFGFRVAGVTAEWHVARMHHVEELSRLYECRLELLTEDVEVDPQDLLDKPCVLTLERAENLRHVCGIVRQIEHLGWVHFNTGRTAMRLLRVTLAPKLWRLSQRVDSRIFQNKSVLTIVREVLEGAGAYRAGSTLDASMLQRDAHMVREYCVQYGESDLDFVMRLLEEEGITFHFEHDAEHGEKLVLSDGFQFTFEWLPTADGSDEVPLVTTNADTFGAESVQRFVWSEQLRPTGVVLRDFDFTHPSASATAAQLTHASPRAAAQGERAVYEYPGRFVMRYDDASHAYGPYSGERFARQRQREHQTVRRACEGRGNVTGLAPGLRFKLREEGPHEAATRAASYLVARVEHFALQRELLPDMDIERDLGGPHRAARYTNEFRCVPLPAQGSFYYQPARATPRPSVRGPQTATVVGPASEEIHVDAHGRVKVQFHWDRLGANDEHSSCWVRVAQAWAGEHFGAMFIPRIGMEVVVTFLEGDPDRPLITGCVYNGEHRPPYALPGAKTRSTIKTNSTPGGGGYNEIRFEDAAGQEEVFVHAARDQNTVVEHDQSLTVKVNRSKTVEAAETNVINNRRTTTVKPLDRLEVNGTSETVINGQGRLTVNTGQGSGNYGIEVAHDRDTWVGNNETVIVVGNRDTTVNNNDTTVVTHDRHTTVGGAETLTVTSRVTIQCGGSTITVTPSGVTISSGGAVTVKGATIALNP